ncbi:MAG: glycosyltransferase family 39 protein [Planctomycetes bacterium]|nr:glycosyltransferase family 39 protein [Planctomycetota bacterium]
MKDITNNPRLLLAILIIISCFVLFFDLGGRGFQNKDYLRFAETAREMMYTGDYVVPHYVGKIYLAKPPLLMWSIALSSQFSGAITPFTARIPSALCALLSIITVFLFGKHLYKNPMAGLWAGLILLSNYMFFLYSRTVKTDMMLATFIFTAIYAFYMGYTSDAQKRRLYFVLFYVSIALAILTKGPLGFIIPILIVLIYLVYKKELLFFKQMYWVMGFGILGLIVGPWVILMCQRIGLDTVINNAFSESVVRYSTEEYGHKQPFYFFIPELIKGFLPYSIFFPATFVYLFSKKIVRNGGDRWWLSIWFVTVFILMSISRCKSARYILPLYPALALMIGGMWTSLSGTGEKNVYMNKWIRYTLAIALVIILILSIGFPVYTFTHYTELFPVGVGIGVIFTAGILGRFFVKRFQNYNVSFFIIIAFFTITALVYMKELSSYNYRHSPGLDLANKVSQYVKKDELYYYEVPDECLSPMNFYMNRLIPEIKNKNNLSSIFLSDNAVYCIVGKKAYDEKNNFHKVPHTLIQNIRYKDIDLVLIANRPVTDQTEW